jgi:hypothetical protein
MLAKFQQKKGVVG